MSLLAALPSRNLTTDECQLREREGKYHFQGPRSTDFTMLIRTLDANASEKEDASQSLYLLDVQPGYMLFGDQQGLPYPEHRRCRSPHRYFHASIYMAETCMLRHHWPPYRDMSATSESGHIVPHG